MVIEDYKRRRQRIPQEWMDRVEVEVWKPKPYYASSSSYDADDDDRRNGR
jgi:hypothetical protein